MTQPQLPTCKARLRGAYAYACPACAWLNKVTCINRRKPMHQCGECGRKWGIGIAAFRVHAAGEAGFHVAPLVAFSGAAQPHQLFNTLDVTDTARSIGQVQGPLDWLCPACGLTPRQEPSREGIVTCPCGQGLYIRLRLWALKPGRKWSLPMDWIL
jgi:hypothetical protein